MYSNLNYLLKYLSMDAYLQLLKKNSYFLDQLLYNKRNVRLNIDYIIKYGVKINDQVILNLLDELIQEPSIYENKIKEYEKKYTKEEIISLIENSY